MDDKIIKIFIGFYGGIYMKQNQNTRRNKITAFILIGISILVFLSMFIRYAILGTL